MQKIVFITLIVLMWSCSRKQPNNNANAEYIDKLISERISMLQKIPGTNNSAYIDVGKITTEIDKLILLSKDVENIDASINESNSYFEKAEKIYGLDSISYVKISKNIPLEDIVGFIKKNELNLLNRILLKINKNGTMMLTAQ